MNCAHTTARIRRHANQEDTKMDPKPQRQINLFVLACSFLLFPLCVCACLCSICILCSNCILCVSVCMICVRANALLHALPTCVGSHFSVISNSPETSGSRSCDGDGTGNGVPVMAFQVYSEWIFLWFIYSNFLTY